MRIDVTINKTKMSAEQSKKKWSKPISMKEVIDITLCCTWSMFQRVIHSGNRKYAYIPSSGLTPVEYPET